MARIENQVDHTRRPLNRLGLGGEQETIVSSAALRRNPPDEGARKSPTKRYPRVPEPTTNLTDLPGRAVIVLAAARFTHSRKYEEKSQYR